jgi:tRNA-modifying protein YgfZ
MPLIDLGTRCLLQIHGPDAVRYLNGQVTQDVRLLAKSPENALPACVTDAKGRLQGFVTLYQLKTEPVTLWIEAPLELRDVLFARLSRYLIADDAEIEDLSESYRLVHVMEELREDGDFSYPRFGVEGYDRWIAASELPASSATRTEEDVEALRIAHAIPRWGKELTEGILPPEAGLDSNAISYEKGCYIGQEVISRIKSAGKVNRRLHSFSLDLQNIPPGSVLIDDQGGEVGSLTSIAAPHALGYLNKKAFGQTMFGLRLSDGSEIQDAVSVKPQQTIGR